jgi:hypothetical protein
LETEVLEPTLATEEVADNNFAGSTPEDDGTEVELTSFIQ